MRYWYFAATLPGFLFGASPPFGDEEFLERCGRFLEPEDYRELVSCLEAARSISVPQRFRSQFLETYVAWERSFRFHLAALRAQASGKELINTSAERLAEGGDQAASTCFAAADPYQAELAFERERWQAVERLSSLASFDLDFVAAYRVKLDIALRLARFDKPTGEQGYRRLYDDILGGASGAATTLSSGAEA